MPKSVFERLSIEEAENQKAFSWMQKYIFAHFYFSFVNHYEGGIR